jgi:hypothetical protein
MGKRVAVLIVGVIVLLGGAALAVAGGALMVAFGSDNTLATDHARVATSTTALVASIDDIQDTKGFASVVGRPTIRLRLTGATGDVFVGVGPAQAVERYLAGSNIDRTVDLEVDPFVLVTQRRPGSVAPETPGTQSFWTAQASGPTASIDWRIKDGSYRIVVMNADASPGVETAGTLALTVPHLFAIGVGVLIVGAVIAIIGLVLLIIGARIRVDRRPAASLPSGSGVEPVVKAPPV